MFWVHEVESPLSLLSLNSTSQICRRRINPPGNSIITFSYPFSRGLLAALAMNNQHHNGGKKNRRNIQLHLSNTPRRVSFGNTEPYQMDRRASPRAVGAEFRMTVMTLRGTALLVPVQLSALRRLRQEITISDSRPILPLLLGPTERTETDMELVRN